MSFEEWSNNKKKKKTSSFEEWSNAERGVSKNQEEEDERKRQAYLSSMRSNDDIAPVRQDAEERTWFKESEGNWIQTILGSKTDIAENVASGFMGIGEKIVDALAVASNAASQQQLMQSAQNEMLFNALTGKKDEGVLERYTGIQEEVEKGTAEFVAKDLYDEKEIAKAIISDNARKIGIDSEKHSVFGAKSDDLAASAGQLGGQLLSEAILPGSGMVLMGATTFGSEMESALQNGAEYDEAMFSSLVSTGAELLSEKLGGVKFGGKTLTDAAFGALSKKVTSKFAKALVSAGKIGADASAEAVEEIVSGYVSAWGQKLSYMEDKEIEELFTKEDLLESAIGGFVLGGGFSVGEAAISGRDPASGLTKHEQAVVDKVVDGEIASKETDGKKLTGKEKAEIRDSVIERMEHGQIDIDTIEEVLGGDTYKAYKDTVESEDALKTELSELRKMKSSDMNDIQVERMNELKGMNLDDTTKRDGLRKTLDDTLSPMLQNSKLSESYRERERRGQAFEADLSKYTGKKKEAVERAVKSGVLNNTYRSHELVELLSEIEATKGITFNYSNNERLAEAGFTFEGKVTNGFADKNKATVTLNVQSKKAWQSVVGHEITHVLETNPEAYKALRESLYAYAESKGELASRRAATEAMYNGVNADIDAELTADMVGDYLFSDKDFVKHLTGNRTMFQKIYDEIKYLWSVATGKEKTEIEKVKEEFDRAWSEYSADEFADKSGENSAEVSDVGTENVQYSIREEDPPKKTIKGYKVFRVVDGKLYPPMVDNPSGNGTPVGVWLNADIGGLAHNKDGSVKLNTEGRFAVESSQGGSLSFRPGWHLGEYPDASQFGRMDTSHPLTEEELATYSGKTYKDKKSGNTYPMNLFPYNFVWAECDVAADRDYQLDAMSLGVNDKGSFVRSRAGLPYVPADGYYKYRTNPDPNTAPWIISGAIKVNRILSDAEVAEICAQHGVTPQTREGYTNLKKKDGGSRTPGDAINLADFGLVSGEVAPTDAIALAEIYAADGVAKKQSETAMSLLKTLPGYAKRKIDFADEKILNEFAMNNQDAEYYRNLAESTGDGYLADDKLYSEENKSEDVKVLDGGTAVKYSLSTWTPETKDKVRKNLVKAGYEAERVDKWIDDLNGVASVIAADKDRLGFEAADNQVMLKNNQEYIKTLDASTLCAKRLQYQGTFDAIQHRLPNTVLTSDDLIELQNMLKEHGYEAPCSVCYVESRRRHLGKFAQEWLDGYEGEYKPHLDEVTTSDGLEKLRHSHPDTYKSFVDAMNAKGSANPKVVQLRTEYRNDIMSLTKKQVEKIEAIGGLRIQSFSDFETPHLLDMMQAVMDMSAKGLTSQAYTKVPNFAWVFGDTGIKINLSLIAEGNGFDSDGNLAFSSVEGMDINDAMAVRDAYSENVGTIIVGANDAHILACMADDRIDYIIPFHRSGWGKNEMEMTGLGSYEDYSYGQNEHDIATGKKVSNLYPPDYWDYNVSGKENAERYLKLCAQTGREPKFSNFLVNNGDGSYSLQPDGSTDGYWKTLIDFKMYDNEGKGAKQQKVQPNFNMEEAYRVLNEYEGGANSLPVAKDVVEEFVAKHSDDIAPTPDVQYSVSDSDYMSAVERGDTETAQMMVNEAAKAAGYTRKLYHGTASKFNVFGFGRTGIFTTDNFDMAKTYGNNVMSLYGKEGAKVLHIDAKESPHWSIEVSKDVLDFSEYPLMRGKDRYSTNDISLIAFREGYDVVVIDNVYDNYSAASGNTENGLGTDVVYKDPNQVKSSEAITYDDNGNVIPLSQRFNSGNDDIRYSLSNEDESFAPVGNYSTPFRELALGEDIAPVAPTKATEAPSLADIPVLPDEPVAEEEPVKNMPPMSESDEEIIKTVKERLNAKITNSATELEETKLLRDWVKASYENKIEKLQTTLDSKKNKDTKVAIALRKRIANLKRVSADVDADIQKRISDIESRISKTAKRMEEPPKKDILEVRYERIDKQLEEDKIALKEDFDKRKVALWEATQDKTSYISNKALDLYNEVKSMRKGVRVSGELGYLLDNLDLSEEHKSESYKRLRQALIDIKNRPSQTVNQYSEIESIAREMLNSSYEDAVYDLDDMDNQYQEDVKRLEADAEAQKKAIREQAEALHRADVQRQKLSEVESILNSKGFSLDEMLDNPVRQLSTFETVDTMPQRVMEKTFGYEAGQALADATVNKVAQNESAGLKWLDSITNRKNGLLAQLSKQYNIKPHSKEIAAAMMYGEGSWVNEETGEEFAYGDAELAKDFTDVKVQNNIKALVRDPRIRQFYDETLDAINEARKRNGYPEIPRRANYFLHYRELGDFFTKHGLPFNPNDARAKDLPTDMVGRTADLKPGQPFFTSSWQRKGKKTSYDLFEGMERYANSAKNQIYHIDDIQTLRALHYHLAERFGQAQGLENLNKLTPEQASEQIKKVYGSHLSTFAAFLDTEANILAGKTSMIDRALSEGMLGRRILTFMDALNQQTGATMVGYNVSSANTNWLPVVREFANSNPVDSVKALAQTVANIASRGKLDSFREDSTVYIRRQGADRFNRKLWQKMQDPAYALMGAVDSISTEIIARTEYNKAIREGMNPQQAHYESDKKVSRLMADRSLGQMPQMYTSRAMGLITKFQLEVRNDMDSMFYDTIQEEKLSRKDIENARERNAKTAAKVAWRYGATAIALHAFGQAFEAVAGYNPAFDIIEAIVKTFGWDDDEDDEDTWRDNLGEGAMSLLEDLPYAGIVLDGGRIPISSAIPDLKGMIEGKDEYGNDKSAIDHIKEIAPYMLPAGGNQLKKTVQGLKMFSDEHPVTGSYTDSGSLRFPVEKTPLNVAQAALFGQYASKNAREYFDNDYAPLKAKQIQEYIDVGMPIKDYWEYREGLNDIAPLPGKKSVSLEQKLDYVDSMDLPTRKKNILVNNLSDRKDPIDMTSYGDYGSLEEFDFATDKPEKYAFAKSVGGYSAYKTYSDALYDIKGDKDASGKTINGSRKAKVLDYINNLDADYYTKILLWKSEYPSDDSYDYEIVEYLNNRSDLTYTDRVNALTELGFRVTADGQIYVD